MLNHHLHGPDRTNEVTVFFYEDVFVMRQEEKANFACLIVEDDAFMAQAIALAVELEGGQSTICGTIEQAKITLKTQEFAVVILDNYLPDGKGSTFFGYLRDLQFCTPCIMLTGMPELSMAVELTREGLFEYLTKPFDANDLRKCLKRAVANFRMSEASLKAFEIVDFSPAMKSLRRHVNQAAANATTTVLLTGETGVGKDVVARLIHQLTFQTRDCAPPFVALNCSALPADMFEAELFGAQKGAYTGSHQNRIGLAETTKGGTLFLDEIGEVPLVLQAKLLQFLESREFRRLGSTQLQRMEGRIIAATNRSLETEVREGRFRQDLWYRLNVFHIHIPPLRGRQPDLPALIDILLTSHCKKSERSKPQMKLNDLQLLQQYDYPGNIRELRNILERSLIQTPVSSNWLQLDRASIKIPEAALNGASATKRLLPPFEEQEYALIEQALIDEKGVIRKASKRLKTSHQTLLRRLEKWPELRKLIHTGSPS